MERVLSSEELQSLSPAFSDLHVVVKTETPAETFQYPRLIIYTDDAGGHLAVSLHDLLSEVAPIIKRVGGSISGQVVGVNGCRWDAAHERGAELFGKP